MPGGVGSSVSVSCTGAILPAGGTCAGEQDERENAGGRKHQHLFFGRGITKGDEIA